MTTTFLIGKFRNTDSSSKEGFTLVELVVVLFVIGILSAIALPSFLNQTSKAHQTEARKNVSAVIRAQQLKYSEKADFSTTFDDLALGNLTGNNLVTTSAYTYQLATGITAGQSFFTITASTLRTDTKSYSGLLVVDKNIIQQSFWNSIICENNNPGSTAIAPPDPQNCPIGHQAMK